MGKRTRLPVFAGQSHGQEYLPMPLKPMRNLFTLLVLIGASTALGAEPITTKPMKLSGAALHLNAKAEFGEIVVELLDEQGNSLGKSKPVSEDSIDIPVKWEKEIPWPEVTSLKISINNARLYSMWTNYFQGSRSAILICACGNARQLTTSVVVRILTSA